MFTQLERARSISPTKESPSNSSTPTSIHTSSMMNTPTQQKQSQPSASSAGSSSLSMPARNDEYKRIDQASPIMGENGRGASPSTNSDATTVAPPNSSAPPSRSGTLSWQQRPTSKGSAASRSRPLSMVATENNRLRSPRATPEPVSVNQTEVSRSQIAQSLGSKDPAWFRQTADRGLGSAAYRKDKDDTVSDASLSGSMRLPGMSKKPTVEPEKESSPVPENTRPSSLSREGSLRGKLSWGQTHSSTLSVPSGAIGSPLPMLSSQRLEPPSSDGASSQSGDPASNRSLAMSPSQGRISPERVERPSSPTKGLGGFVQSAMLKRSDSVNKRWSAQAGPGLSRGNSIASNRSGYDGSRYAMNNMSPPSDIKAGSPSREQSPVSTSRPGSSHSNPTAVGGNKNTQNTAANEEGTSGLMKGQGSDGFIKPALPELSRAHSRNLDESRTDSPEANDKTPPPSPSKTMDSKRWSPAKASWLESAINKPDSPKPRNTVPLQPSWMVDISKAKQQRGSVDSGKSTSFKEVTTSGLLRSPPMGGTTKPPIMNGLSSNLIQDSSNRGKTESSNGLTKTTSLPKSITPDTIASVSGKPPLVSKPPQADTFTARTWQSEPESQTKVVSRNVDNSSDADLQKSISLKQKPETPPKKDFRSNLRSRQVSGGNAKNEEPEFKNVFGKLKRAQTQNYVAPDELKDNILRGKAGLATTGGPKKTERRDEFKESILKKKEEMKAGPPIVNQKTHGPPTPEAGFKKEGAVKSEDIADNAIVLEDLESKTPRSALHPVTGKEHTKPVPPEKQPSAPGRLQSEPTASGKLADRFNPNLAGILSRGPSPMTGGARPPRTKSPSDFEDNSSSPVILKSETSSSNQLTHMTKARARGPKRRLPASTTTEASPGYSSRNQEEKVVVEPLNGLDTNRATTPQPQSTPTETLVTRPLANITNSSNKTIYTKPSSKPNTPIKPAAFEDHKQLSPHSPNTPKQPFPSQKSSSLSLKEPLSSSPKSPHVRKPSTQITRPLPTTPTSSIPAEKTEVPSVAPISASNHSTSEPEPVENQEPTVSVIGAAAKWGLSKGGALQQPQRIKSPIKLPTRKDEEAAMKFAGLNERNSKEPVGLGIQALPDEVQKPAFLQRGLPSPPMNSPKPSPMRPPKPESIATRAVSNGGMSLAPSITKESPIPKTSEATRLFTDFFDEAPTSKTKIDIDTQTVLSSRYSPDEAEKIKTLRKQIWEINGDGKKKPVPSHQEHILYEDKMYICTHVFGSSNGTRTTEVYLWAGDAVSSSALEDAQLFSRKTSKESGGKLSVLKQGRETSNFFQALGGIVITRRGSNSTYMLCGRRHVGQIAFDEVPFTSSSLCSGFPYIISARFGKLYLWKGKGSGADELGCARLIGMDLGLTGEIEEVDDGSEPEEFWESFPGGKVVDVGSHWRLKPSCEGYTTRLFRVELEARPKSSSGFMWGRRGSTPAPSPQESTTANIKEIVPFSQQDLSADGVFVLDTFFEIYMFVFLFPPSYFPFFTIIDIFQTASPAPTQLLNSLPFKRPSSSRRNMASSLPQSKTDLSSLSVASCSKALREV